MKTKIFAAYLPQFHEIPENDEFWGEGYTDWVATKNAKPQYEGHIQPKEPLNDNYYDLSIPSNIKWQAELANQYGIAGFNIYHYWFENSHKVLEKPAEIILNDPGINIEYFFSWDNTSWRSGSWTNVYGDNNQRTNNVLLNIQYGTEKDWREHFDYLLPFFLDNRYLKIYGKPVFALMRTTEPEKLVSMKNKWDEWAKENGLNGVYMITGCRVALNQNVLDGLFKYQPRISAWGKREAIEKIFNKIPAIKNINKKKYYYDYETIWKNIIKDAKKNIAKNIYFGGVVKFDDTPRRGNRARILLNPSPLLFEHYLKQLYSLCSSNEKEFLLLTAWNEWGEGACLEPDKIDGYSYLEAVKRVVEE